MASTKSNAAPGLFGWHLFKTTLGLALDSIQAHKLRSCLTLLGVIIGVASVVLVGSAIEGMGEYAETSTSRVFGSNSFVLVRVAGGRLTRSELAEKLRYNKNIRREDLEYLRATTGDKIQYSPYYQRAEDAKRLVSGQAATFEGAIVLGTSAELSNIRDIALEQGRYFTEPEEANRQFVAVIGHDLQTELFPVGEVLNQVISIRGFEFRVIGLVEKLGQNDNSIYIPSTIFEKLFPVPTSMTIFGSPRSESGLSMNDALDTARSALRSRYHTRPGKPDNFDNITPDSVRAFIDQILGLVRVIVLPVTLISLLVGGIVIMNIMLVSVTERTREIGVRKAVGARQGDIQLQFLVEATILAAVGGVIGLLLGAIAARGLGAVLGAELPVTWPYVVLAVLLSSVVGIISGWYPAVRAARLDPITALRAE